MNDKAVYRTAPATPSLLNTAISPTKKDRHNEGVQITTNKSNLYPA